MFIIAAGILLFVEFATISLSPDAFGTLGVAIGEQNILLFGYFAYIYPVVGIVLLYLTFRHIKKINFRFIELVSGLILLFFTILIAQANIFVINGGRIGYYIVSGLKDMIGSAGMWVFIAVIFGLSLVLIFEEKIAVIIKKAFISTKKDLEIKIDTSPSNDENLEVKEAATKPDIKSQSRKKPKEIDVGLVENISKDEELSQNLENFSSEITKNSNLKPEAKNEFKKVEHLSEIAENKKLLDNLEKGSVPKVKDFELPPLKFLNDPPKKKKAVDEAEIDQKIFDLLDKLRQFKINGDVVRTYSGPVVTTFEFRPAADVKVSKILNLQDDLAMALKAETIRIQAPIPGKDVVGIEIPNKDIETIYLKEILESEIYKSAASPLTIALGKDIVGQPFVTDLKKLPHLLIAGTTGSGKSVGINAMLLSLLYRNSPQTLRLIMIDPKMLEFSIYNDIPHLLTPVITDHKKAITALANLVAEMERRYKTMASTHTKNIENYNQKATKKGLETMPYIVVIIDELADLMMVSGKDVEFYIARLAQMARASGIHLIVATQRPSVNVVTGLIKANLPSRVSYRVGQKIDSKVILDQMGAESLLGRGDMLFTPPGSPGLIRLHAPFASEEEILKVVEFLKAQGPAIYDESFLVDEESSTSSSSNSDEALELDELYNEAKEVILSDEKTSISYLQRRLKIGYNRAATIIEQLEKTGVLSEPNSKGQREIL
ncbi:DNA translocase FtsK 4TM domain-containing protein [Campylobacter corcagiensis]|uniref:DNA translocase FtsK 4TM domain-containing protein n=1 Tax=Campylobacter corcagiensis TaxID=1448857 RepID=A0A7M1LK21_9BACT|nr:DNA translocase FtsK 4TM domain-containing protein [Campylobacter corcagiensis]